MHNQALTLSYLKSLPVKDWWPEFSSRYANATDSVAALAGFFGQTVIDQTTLDAMNPAFDLLSFAEANNHHCMLYRDASENLYLVHANPLNPNLSAFIETHVRKPFTWALVEPLILEQALHQAAQMQESRPVANIMDVDDFLKGDIAYLPNITLQSLHQTDNPTLKLVDSTIYDALKSGASDIHFETTAQGLSVKYRLDGILVSIVEVSERALVDQALSRIKVMAELDIAERRIPQDGRFRIRVDGRAIDFRVSVMPSLHGEDAVIRILDKQALAENITGLRLDHLGLDITTIETLRKLATQPHGMLLVTGPTGSGKTTTLYGLLSEIHHGQDKIITIEDPIEYEVPGILQIPVNEKKGLTFARGLRSILRHDPDKIMVGEIRDSETADIAVQAALTGHLVFTTVHANNLFDVVSRLLHMGIERYSLVSALNGVVAQRLLRKVCVCRNPRGCEICRYTGYKGRMAIAEVLVLNPELKSALLRDTPLDNLREMAKGFGLVDMREQAYAKVQNGDTYIEEVERVFGQA